MCRRTVKYCHKFTDNLARIRSVLYYGLQYFSSINLKLFSLRIIKNYRFTSVILTHCVSSYVYPSKPPTLYDIHERSACFFFRKTQKRLIIKRLKPLKKRG